MGLKEEIQNLIATERSKLETRELKMGQFRSAQTARLTVLNPLLTEYYSKFPIELVAYFGHFAFDDNKTLDLAITHLLKDRGLGKFRRVWILRENSAVSLAAYQNEIRS